MVTKPKHIVIDARNRRDSGGGRYSSHLITYLEQLDSVDHFTVLLHPEDTWRPSNERFSVCISPYQQFSLNPLEQIGFAWQLYRLRADLVHFTMTQHPLLYFRSFVVTTHDLTMLRFTRPGRTPLPIFLLKKLGYRLLFWLAHRKARAILVPSEYVKSDLTQLHPFVANKTWVTLEAADPPLTASPSIPPIVRKPFIFHAGSPFPHKNIERLIQAFEQLQANFSSLQLVLVGKKEYYFEQLESWITHRPHHGSIIFTGFVSDGELKWLYEHAEAYVLPSLSEGFGLPGLEAMVHSCPLVSSNATCLPEIYGDAAHYFNPEDVADIAAKITEVLNDQNLRARLVKKGLKQSQKYSWPRMAKQTMHIYARSMT